jgi:hypothetical protein
MTKESSRCAQARFVSLVGEYGAHHRLAPLCFAFTQSRERPRTRAPAGRQQRRWLCTMLCANTTPQFVAFVRLLQFLLSSSSVSQPGPLASDALQPHRIFTHPACQQSTHSIRILRHHHIHTSLCVQGARTKCSTGSCAIWWLWMRRRASCTPPVAPPSCSSAPTPSRCAASYETSFASGRLVTLSSDAGAGRSKLLHIGCHLAAACSSISTVAAARKAWHLSVSKRPSSEACLCRRACS